MKNGSYQEIYKDKSPQVRIRGIIIGNNNQVKIISSEGLTEAEIRKGADIVADNTQSGGSLTDNKLRAIEEIMVSSVGLYAGPSCVGWKEKKALEMFEQLYGAILGKRFFDVEFNVPMDDVEKLRNYLVAQHLCADEPTIVLGQKFAQVNILIPKSTFPNVLQTLREDYGASAVKRNNVKQFIR